MKKLFKALGVYVLLCSLALNISTVDSTISDTLNNDIQILNDYPLPGGNNH